MTHAGYVDAKTVISDVVRLVDDTRFKDISEGEYIAMARQAVINLGFDSYFDEQVVSIPLNGKLVHRLPDGLMNIVHVFAYNGDRCSQGHRATVWHARGYFRDKNLQLREQTGVQHDPIMDSVLPAHRVNETLFYNTLGPNIMLSDAVAAYQSLHIEFRGIGGAFDTAPIIPYALMDAVKWWVAHEALTILVVMRKDTVTDRALERASKSLYGDGRLDNPGAWRKAMRRIQSSDQKELEDLEKYIKSMGKQTF